ncbi:MAG TPA: ATP synthase F1 subunit delta [Terriglobales bacterium]|jgi:F-type H+-transporting ATPase subunit delta
MAEVHSRYARALVDVVADLKLDGAAVLAQLRLLVELLKSSVELRRVWENPAIPAGQKRKLLDAIVARENVAKPVRNFVAVLIDNRRIAALPEIAKQVELEMDRRLGLAEAEVTSARELSPEERRDLEAQMVRLTGKNVRAHYATDGKLLGGAVVRLGSTIYDGSVRGQLHRMKERLSAE